MKKKRLVVILTLVIAVASATVFFTLRGKDKSLPSHTEHQQQVELPVATPDNLLTEVNKQRTLAGVPPLKLSQSLNESARLKCEDMVQNDYYGHENPETGKHGYEYIEELLPASLMQSENLNKGFFNDAYSVVSDSSIGWMGSKPHREAMLSADFTDTGFSSCVVESNAAGAIAKERIFVQHMAKIP